VLGLGGWFLGALIVLTTMPGVRIDNKLLIILSVGVPIGLGAYWAWVHRDWSARSKVSDSRRRPQAGSPAPGWGSTPRTACWQFSPRSSGPSSAPTSR
jgi:hypothetical protein